MSTDQKFTKFDYLLNALVHAGQQDKPVEHDYYGKRQALFAYVRDLEARAAMAPAGEPVDRAEVLRLAHAYADAKLQRYGILNIKNPPDPQVAFEALDAALVKLLGGK